jgi:cell division protein YceG involved in septum cleavage
MAAALNPADGDWLYYVLVDPSGAHFFTVDYDEFLAKADDARARGVFK